jgi:hypothetical protein
MPDQPPHDIPCPVCGETVFSVAKKCKHCGEWLDRPPIEQANTIAEKADYTRAVLSVVFVALFACIPLYYLIIPDGKLPQASQASSPQWGAPLNAEELRDMEKLKNLWRSQCVDVDEATCEQVTNVRAAKKAIEIRQMR